MLNAPFFILGNPRSGTSLFRLMLNSHPQIIVPSECGFLQWWYSKYKDWTIEDSQNFSKVRQYCKDILSSKKMENWPIEFEKLLATIIAEKPNSYAELSILVYKQYNVKKKGLIGDKNNYYIHHLELLNKIYPNTKYIHIIRDGRDVAASYLKLNQQKVASPYAPKLPIDVKDIAVEWQHNIYLIDSFIENKDSIVVRYEDLLRHSEETLGVVTEFLGTNFAKEMLLFYKKEYHDEPSNTMGWKQKTLEEIDPNNTKKYLNVLTPEEIVVFNQVAKDLLIKYNYV